MTTRPDSSHIDSHPPLTPGKGRWLDRFNPDDAAFWQQQGRFIARRNLWLSIFAEFLGFAIWQLWAVVAPLLNQVGYQLSADQIFWLIAVPNLTGATLRFPYTFAVPRFGGRNWTVISSLLLLLPCLAVVYVTTHPGLPFAVVVVLAALGGVGGGNFASSMSNISFFFPEAQKGKALGMNAAGGNIGVAVAILVIPLLVSGSATPALDRAGWVWVPFALLSALMAFFGMHNLRSARSDVSSFTKAFKNRHTWAIAVVYVATFGSFIGFSGVFPTLLNIAFPGVSLSLAFMGPLVGSLTRPLGGMLADRSSGSSMTQLSLATMVAGVLLVLLALSLHSLWLFFVAFMFLFIVTGIGNGACYRMIPIIFTRGVDANDQGEFVKAKRVAAAAMGIIAAIGAYGGFVVPRTFAISQSQTGSLAAALYLFIVFYILCMVLIRIGYSRSSQAA